MSFSAAEIKKLVKEYQLKAGDTGSPEVQVALLSANISRLTEHFKQHKHDYHSRRGLLRMVSQRHKLLQYLRNQDINRYNKLIQRLNLRVAKKGEQE